MVRKSIACVVLLILAWPALAEEPATWFHGARDKKGRQLPDRFGFSAGVFAVTGIDIEAGISPAGLPIAARVDFGDDLNLENSDTSYRLDGYWRFTPRHRIDFAYYNTRVLGDRTLEGSLTWDGQEYVAGMQIRTLFEQDTYKVNYLYSYYHSEKVELGVGAGLHTTDLVLGLSVRNLTDFPLLDEDFNEEGRLSATAPLPVFSLLLEYRIAPRLSFRVRSDYFAIGYEEYSGRFQDSFFLFEYRAARHFSLGAGWDRVQFDVDFDGTDKKWVAGIDYDGYLFYGKAVF